MYKVLIKLLPYMVFVSFAIGVAFAAFSIVHGQNTIYQWLNPKF